MCLAVPGKVVEIDQTSLPLTGKVAFGGILKTICFEWIPDVAVGDYVLVHVGFAISRLDEDEALKTIQLFDEMNDGLDELREMGDQDRIDT